MKRAGFREEIRRIGDTAVTLWRLRTGPSPAPGAAPNRLLFFSGLGDSPLSWLPAFGIAAPVLKRSFDELILVDFPGTPGHLWERPFFSSLEQAAEVTQGLIDSLAPRVLMGHSLGGWLAARCLSRGAESKRAWKPELLILIAPSGLFPDEAAAMRFGEIFSKAADADPRSLMERFFVRPPRWFRIVEREVGAFTSRPDTAGFIRSISYADSLGAEGVGRIGVKTRLIWGDADRLCDASWAGLWVNSLPRATGAEAILIPGAAHSPHLETPARLASALGRILSGGDLRANANPGWWRVLAASDPLP